MKRAICGVVMVAIAAGTAGADPSASGPADAGVAAPVLDPGDAGVATADAGVATVDAAPALVTIDPAAPPIPALDHTAADVRGAPQPGDESGRADVVDPGASAGRKVARVALFLPKVLVELALLPFRGLVFLDDRYDLSDRYYQWFFNADHTIGVYPTATYDTGFGASVGARFEDLNLFGDKESAAFQATTGALTGEVYRESFVVALRTGNRLSQYFQLGLDANFDRRPADPFYGIGNGNQTATLPAVVINPLVDDTAIETYNRYQEERVSVFAEARITHELHVIATGSLTDLHFGPSSSGGQPIGDVYNTADLVGFNGGVEHTYGELEVRWDTRRRVSPWEPVSVHSAGSLVDVFAGRIDRLDGGADFSRYGIDLQHYIRLAKGPRLIALRFRTDGVTGSRDQVPFEELPMLGGADFLRGYSYGRFRDRIASFASIQYQWDLSHMIDAYLFCDVGRVFQSLDDVTADGMRVGYGIGLEVHSDHGFVIEGDLASSIDGGIVTTISFNPIPDYRPRWR